MARKRRAVRKPGTAIRSGTCSSSYQRWNSDSIAGSISVVKRSRPRDVVISLLPDVPTALPRLVATSRSVMTIGLNYELGGRGPFVVLLHPVGLDLTFLAPVANN